MENAKIILSEKRAVLNRLAEILIEKESLNAMEIKEITAFDQAAAPSPATA